MLITAGGIQLQMILYHKCRSMHSQHHSMVTFIEYVIAIHDGATLHTFKHVLPAY